MGKNNFWRSAHRRSIFKRLLVVYLLCTIPVTAMVFVNNKLVLDELYDHKVITMQTYLVNQKKQIETEIDRIYAMEQSIGAADIHMIDLYYRFSLMSSVELGNTVAAIHQDLYSIKNTSALVKNASVYIPNIDREISTSQYYDDQIELSHAISYFEVIMSPYRYVTYYQGAMFVSYRANTSPVSKYFIQAEIDQIQIQRIFNNVENNINAAFISNECKISNEVMPEALEQISGFVYNTAVPDDQIYTGSIWYDGQESLIAYTHSEMLNGTFVVYMPVSEVFGNVRTYSLVISLLGGLTMIIVLFYIRSLHQMIKHPLDLLTEAFKKVETGRLDITASYEENNEFGDLMNSFNMMTTKLKTVIDEVYIKDINLRKSQLERLQAQISPHFLYNSFSILKHSISRGNEDTALIMADSLSSYFKYITQNNMDFDTLFNEFDFARTYVEIQKLRFSGRINIEFENIDPRFGPMLVPRMILQPLIENAFKHAFIKTDSNGELYVGWKHEKSILKLIVQDNGTGVSQDKLEQIVAAMDCNENTDHDGICNVHQRLKLFYQDDRYGLNISSREGQFFRIEIHLPDEPAGNSKKNTKAEAQHV